MSDGQARPIGLAPPPPPPPPPVAAPPPPPPSFAPPPPGQLHGHTGLGYNSKTSRSSFRRLNWQKIPKGQIDDSDNIWSATREESSDDNLKLNIATIDELFKLPENKHKNRLKSPSPNSWKTGNVGEQQDDGPITLLDPKKSLNINIFLKQFKKSTDAIVTSIETCENSILNSEQLHTLLRLLPEDGREARSFTEFSGDKNKLDTAEQFLLKILKIPQYKTRIEGTLLRDSFEPSTKYIEASLDTLERAMREIRNCKALPKIMHLVLQAGNYLNQGASFGNASGFRLASLKALSDTKANKPGITLMHYVSMTLESQNRDMMTWPDELTSLTDACKVSEKELTDDIVSYSNKIKTLKTKMKSDSIKLLESFIEMAEGFLKLLKEKEKRFICAKRHFAKYLCENPTKFKLQECFEIVEGFRKTFVKASTENKEREKRKNRKQSSRLTSKSEVISYSKTPLRHSTNAKTFSKKTEDNSSVPSRHTISTTLPRSRETQRENKNQGTALDIDKIKHVTLTKLDPMEVHETLAKSSDLSSPTPSQDDTKLTVKNAWQNGEESTSPSNTSPNSVDEAVANSIRRRRRKRSDRSISLMDGAWSENSFRAHTRERLSPRIMQDDLALEVRQKEERLRNEEPLEIQEVGDQEKSFLVAERENAFARTRMRRSYISLDRAETFDEPISMKEPDISSFRRTQSEIAKPYLTIPAISINDEDTIEQKPRAGSLDKFSFNRSTRIATLLSERDEEAKRKSEEIREKIRKYKESTSKLEEEDVRHQEKIRTSSRESISFTPMDTQETEGEVKAANDRLAARRSRRSAKLAQLSQFYKETESNTLLYATTDAEHNTNVHMVEAETDIFSDLASRELENLDTENVVDGAGNHISPAEDNTTVSLDKKSRTASYSKKSTTVTPQSAKTKEPIKIEKSNVKKPSNNKPQSALKSRSMVNVSRTRTPASKPVPANKVVRKDEAPTTSKTNSLLRSKRLSTSALNLSTTPKNNFINKIKTTAAKSTKKTSKKYELKNPDEDSRERSVSDPISPEEVKKADVNQSWVTPPQKSPPKTTQVNKKPNPTTTVHKTIKVVQHTKVTEPRTKKSAPSAYKFQSLPRTPKPENKTPTSGTLPRSSSKGNLNVKSSTSSEDAKGSGAKQGVDLHDNNSTKTTLKSPTKKSNLRSASSANISRTQTPKTDNSDRIDAKNTRINLSSRSSTDITKSTTPQATGVTMNRAARLRMLMKTPTPDKQKMKSFK